MLERQHNGWGFYPSCCWPRFNPLLGDTSWFSFVGTSWCSLGLVPALWGGLCFPNKHCLGRLEGKLPSWLSDPHDEETGLCVYSLWCEFLSCVDYFLCQNCYRICISCGAEYLNLEMQSKCLNPYTISSAFRAWLLISSISSTGLNKCFSSFSVLYIIYIYMNINQIYKDLL